VCSGFGFLDVELLRPKPDGDLLREGERGRDESGRLRKASASEDRGDVMRDTSPALVLRPTGDRGSRVSVDSRDRRFVSSSLGFMDPGDSGGVDLVTDSREVDEASVIELASWEIVVVGVEEPSVPASAFAFFAAAFLAFFSSLSG
jgi:hypothetical protein